MSQSVAEELRELGADDALLCTLDHARVPGNDSPPTATTPLSKRKTESPSALLAEVVRERSTMSSRFTDLTDDGRAAVSHSGLVHPPKALIPKIIREFLRKDEELRRVLNNYNYHQLVIIKQLDKKCNVVGSYHREWEVVFDDKGTKVSRVTYTKPASLKRIRVTEDGAQPFDQTLFSTEVRQDYEFKYLDHVPVDKVTAYMFSARPRKIGSGKHYFEGTIWVEDQDLQVVKVDGRRVPPLRTVKRGIVEETLFPHFVEYRQEVDGRYWFPTVDFSDDTLQFAFGPVHVQVLERYSDYKLFGAESQVMSAMSNLIFPQNANAPQIAEPQSSIIQPK
jgi:hypothetical protein